MENHHGTVFDGEASEAPLELIAIVDRSEILAAGRLIARQETQVGRPGAGTATLGVAGTHEKSIRPGVEVRRVAESGKIAPDAQQRALRRILSEIGIAQDPLRYPVETIDHGDGEAREGLFITALCQAYELGVHGLHDCGVALRRRSARYGRAVPSRNAIFVDATGGRLVRCGVASLIATWIADPSDTAREPKRR